MRFIKLTKSALYNKYKIDIWGQYSLNDPYIGFPNTRRLIGSLFIGKMYSRWEWRWKRNIKDIYIYRLDITSPSKRKWKIDYKPLIIRMLRYFYLYLKPKNMRRIKHYALKRQGSFEAYFLLGMEGRLSYLAYRTHIIHNIFSLKQILGWGILKVNGCIINYANFTVKPFDVIQIIDVLRVNVIEAICLRFKQKLIFFRVPRYICINYQFFFFFIKRQIRLRDLAYTNRFIDIYKALDFI